MINIAVVGTGGISKRHGAAMRDLPESEGRIAAVYDVAEERAEQFVKEFGGQVYRDLDACMEKADLVYILTPPSTHKELALKAIRKGKHVFVEKPITNALDEAREIIQAAKEQNVLVMTGFNKRFRRGFRKLKETYDSGILGEAINIWSHRIGTGVGSKPNWRTTKGMLCGMSIESLSHDIDMIRWMAGEIIDVRANLYFSRPDLPEFDDNANVVMTMANGATALIHASWTSPLQRNIRGIIGRKGAAFIEGRTLWDIDHIRIKTRDMENEVLELINDVQDPQSYKEHCQYFIDCIRGRVPPFTTGDDGLATLQVSHAILRSHHEQRVVRVDSL